MHNLWTVSDGIPCRSSHILLCLIIQRIFISGKYAYCSILIVYQEHELANVAAEGPGRQGRYAFPLSNAWPFFLTTREKQVYANETQMLPTVAKNSFFISLFSPPECGLLKVLSSVG